MAIFLHHARDGRAAVGGSDRGGFFRRCRIIVVVQVRGVACRYRLVLRDAHAVLVPIALHALFALALFIVHTVDTRAPVRGLHVVSPLMFHPLSLITGSLVVP